MQAMVRPARDDEGPYRDLRQIGILACPIVIEQGMFFRHGQKILGALCRTTHRAREHCGEIASDATMEDKLAIEVAHSLPGVDRSKMRGIHRSNLPLAPAQ